MYSEDRAETNGKAPTFAYQQLVKPASNYVQGVKPQGKMMEVPPTGVDPRQAKMRTAVLDNLKNAWDLKAKEADVAKSMHNAHSKEFEAMGAGVKASNAFVMASTAWNSYQVSLVDNRISVAEKNAAILSIPNEIKRISIEVEMKNQQLIQAETDLKEAMIITSVKKDLLSDNKQLAGLQGHAIAPTPADFIKDLGGFIKPSGDIAYTV